MAQANYHLQKMVCKLAHRYAIFLCSLDVEIQQTVATPYMGGQIVSAIAEAGEKSSDPKFYFTPPK